MPDTMTELLPSADAPDPELMAAVHRHGSRRTINAVFDHALDVQDRDPEAALLTASTQMRKNPTF
jgi:hypothetical protein